MPGEPVAEGRAGKHPAEAAAQRTNGGTARGRKEAPGVHEPAEEIRRGCVPVGEDPNAGWPMGALLHLRNTSGSELSKSAPPI